MKNFLKTFLVTAIAGVSILNTNAQSVTAGLSEKDITGPTSAIESMTGEQRSRNVLNDINPRAVKDFQKSFKGITSEEWSKLNDGYIASFSVDSVQTMVAYNLNGIWHHTIRSYGEKKLPRQIRDVVKRVYYDYAIIKAAEVYFDDQPVYIVYIQDETHLKTIGIYDGEIKEVHNYKRA
ncbi:MAG TPA: hypothetical protein VH396_11605 [Chitinophagaceae bacterium]